MLMLLVHLFQKTAHSYTTGDCAHVSKQLRGNDTKAMTKHFNPLAATNMVHSASVDEDRNFSANRYYLTPTNHMFTSHSLSCAGFEAATAMVFVELLVSL